MPERRRANYNQLIIRQKVVLESDNLLVVESDPDHYGATFSIETIRQGRPEPTKQLISEVYSSEYRLHVVFLQLQGFLSQIRKSFLHRTNNQLTREFRYYSYEPGIETYRNLYY